MAANDFRHIRELAERKRFTAKKDPLNYGYCKVWRKREVLKTAFGSETLTYEEAVELLNEWPDVEIVRREISKSFDKIIDLGNQRNVNVQVHRHDGIEIESHSGHKLTNPKNGGIKFTLLEAYDWLITQDIKK